MACFKAPVSDLHADLDQPVPTSFPLGTQEIPAGGNHQHRRKGIQLFRCEVVPGTVSAHGDSLRIDAQLRSMLPRILSNGITLLDSHGKGMLRRKAIVMLMVFTSASRASPGMNGSSISALAKTNPPP